MFCKQNAYSLPIPLTSGSLAVLADKEHMETTLTKVDSLLADFATHMPMDSANRGADILPYVTRLFGGILCAFCKTSMLSNNDPDTNERMARCGMIMNNENVDEDVVASVNFDRDLEYFGTCMATMADCFDNPANDMNDSCRRELNYARSTLTQNGGVGVKISKIETELQMIRNSIDMHMSISITLGSPSIAIGCSDFLDDAEKVTNIVHDIISDLHAFMSSTSLSEYSSIASNVLSQLNNSLIQAYTNTPNSIPWDICSWFQNLNSELSANTIFYCHDCPEREEVFRHYHVVIDKYQSFEYSFLNMRQNIITAHSVMKTVDTSMKTAAREYQREAITKQQLADIMESVSGRAGTF